MISIPLIRRRLANDLLGRHIYLFGRATSSTAILRQLADAGAQEGTIVLAEDAGARVSVAALLRQSLPVGAAPLFSAIATLALAEAITAQGLSATPAWPHRVLIDDEPVGRGVVETSPAGEQTAYVILGADIEVVALEKAAGHAIESNVMVAAFLNALDKWCTAYAAHGPAAIRGAVRFLPRAPITAAAMEPQDAG